MKSFELNMVNEAAMERMTEILDKSGVVFCTYGNVIHAVYMNEEITECALGMAKTVNEIALMDEEIAYNKERSERMERMYKEDQARTKAPKYETIDAEVVTKKPFISQSDKDKAKELAIDVAKAAGTVGVIAAKTAWVAGCFTAGAVVGGATAIAKDDTVRKAGRSIINLFK